MASIREKILEKLELLPEPSLHEVLDFVEFLTWRRSGNGQAPEPTEDDPILAVAGTLSFPPLTNEQIDQELYGDFSIKEEPS